ncbi:MAG TPA: DUF2231 domain-containing protein [Chthoniobacterales bacterium]|nr:DUF2231 domain-containing protein [Chthoniobacterales bacterium]
MAGKINFLGHPVHPMVIVFPLGLLPTAVACDIIYLVRNNPNWAHISYWLVAAGVLSGVVAAFFGIADWVALPAGTRAKRLGGWHARVNITMVVLFAISWWLRRAAPDHPSSLAIGLGVIALLFGLIGGWIGGELVYRLSVGVDFDAHVNSPSSLSSRPASDNKETLPASQR